jgi:hypothetical protein
MSGVSPELEREFTQKGLPKELATKIHDPAAHAHDVVDRTKLFSLAKRETPFFWEPPHTSEVTFFKDEAEVNYCCQMSRSSWDIGWRNLGPLDISWIAQCISNDAVRVLSCDCLFALVLGRFFSLSPAYSRDDFVSCAGRLVFRSATSSPACTWPETIWETLGHKHFVQRSVETPRYCRCTSAKTKLQTWVRLLWLRRSG